MNTYLKMKSQGIDSLQKLKPENNAFSSFNN